MGNTSAISKGAVIIVHLDNDNIATPGSSLTGTVYLEVFKESISADFLDIQFNGKEFSKATVKQGKNHYAYYDEHVFFNVSCKLFDFPNGNVMKGKYEYPFSFNIPEGLPARNGAKDYSSNWFLIRYYFEARLHR